MIEILGQRRVAILTILIALNAIMAYWVYGSMAPDYSKQQRQLRSIQGQMSATQQQLDQLLTQFDKIEDQKKQFDALKQKGFFSSQSRVNAQALLEEILFQSKVISARATIGGGQASEHLELNEAEYEVLKSPIEIEITALEDMDVYRYMWLLETQFSGHIHITNLNLTRDSSVSREVLQSIIAGQNPEIVSATIQAEWITLIKKQEQTGGPL